MVYLSHNKAFPAPLWSSKFRGGSGSWDWCVVFYLTYAFPKGKVKSGVVKLREGSLTVWYLCSYRTILEYCTFLLTIEPCRNSLDAKTRYQHPADLYTPVRKVLAQRKVSCGKTKNCTSSNDKMQPINQPRQPETGEDCAAAVCVTTVFAHEEYWDIIVVLHSLMSIGQKTAFSIVKIIFIQWLSHI